MKIDKRSVLTKEQLASTAGGKRLIDKRSALSTQELAGVTGGHRTIRIRRPV